MNTIGTNTGSVTLTTVTQTQTTTNVNSTTNLTSTATARTITLGETAYMFMRAKTITFTAKGLKPNTQYFPFFDNVDVSAYCSTISNQKSSTIVTNARGEVTGNFYLPANVFPAGSHLFQLVDNVQIVGSTRIPDPVYGAAEARYEANGILKQQQTQVTVNTVANTNTVVTSATRTTSTTKVDIELPVIQPPPVIQCESWYFEYAVFTGGTFVFTITTNSSTPPSTSVARPAAGSPSIVTQSITYVSTSSGGSGVWYHTYAARTNVGGSSVAVQTFRQEWIGKTTDTRPDLSTFRPSGLPAGSSVSIVTPWIKINTVACPTKLGLGSATQITTRNVAPYDPLAQSFFIDGNTYPEGVFVTSIGVYFRTVDQSTPVVLELRNMTNGHPGPQVFPGGKVLIPGASAAQSPDATVPTVFRFDFPVYLAPGDEYCFVVKSASLGYNCWCSKLGEFDVTTNKVIDTQPTLGTMFMSENNYTWIPDSTQDIKFDLNIATFDTSKIADVIFRPQKSSNGVENYFGTSQNLPLSYISTTKGTKVLTVKIPMHGLVTGDQIHIEGVDNPVVASAYNNIPAADINGTHNVTVVDEDTVTFTTSGTNLANKTGALPIKDEFYVIDNTVPILPPENALVEAPTFINSDTFSPSSIPTATTPSQPVPPANLSKNSFTVYTNVLVNEVLIDYMKTQFEQTAVTDRISLATATSTAGVEVPYGYRPFLDIPNNNDFFSFEEPRMIATPLNEVVHATELQSPAPISGTSATVNIKMSSQNKNISPVIDTNGMSLMVRTYVIDNQNDELEDTVPAGSFVIGQPYTISSQGDTDFTLIGADSNNIGVSFIATGVGTGTGAAYYNSEILPGVGNALAKYKTQIRSSANFFNKVQLFVTANAPAPCKIDAYVRTSTDRDTHIDQNWVWMPINGVFGTTFRNSPDKLTVNEWFYEVVLPEPFNVYDIKLVMRSTNNSIVPKIYGLRTISDYV